MGDAHKFHDALNLPANSSDPNQATRELAVVNDFQSNYSYFNITG